MLFLTTLDFWSVGGFLIGILSLIIAIVFYFRGKIKKTLKYEITTTELITNDMANIPGISITLEGKSVYSVSSSIIKFTNVGNQTIVMEDFAKLSPLQLSAKNQFYSVGESRIAVDNPNTAPVLYQTSENTVEIKFDFLRSKQSFAVLLVHDGALSVQGELKVGKIVSTISTESLNDKAEKIFIVFEIFYLCLLSFSLGAIICIEHKMDDFPLVIDIAFSIFFTGVILVAIGAVVLLVKIFLKVINIIETSLAATLF